ncbi:ATP-binding cassette domain-containing protein [Candidatus Pelagibacter sp. HIMB109]|uniref:ATP-binding cassette domain-containing protein n=1 Tax=Candidatus Pelagibacter sp. HIMB109 TaxID=3415412 RepID=UPI003F85A02F
MKKNNKKTLVKLENASVEKNKKILVKNISFEVKQGEIVTLIGPNGSGKTTTAKMALGINENFEGNVQRYTSQIGYVPQKVVIDWTLPIRVNDFMQLTSKINPEEINEALDFTGVDHLKNKNLNELSGGEFQRILIARAIAKKPELLVLDEPVQGVDFKGEISLYELIKSISKKTNCGILLISHDLHVVMSATDYVVCLNGHICCSGTPKKVANSDQYRELFGDRASTMLSIYEHNHDHSHSTDGTIKKNN